MHIHPGPQRRRLYRMDCHGAACELSALAQVAIDCRHGWPPRQLQTAPHTQVSKVLRKWFLTTCSVVPMIFPISRLVRPCHTRVANLNLLGGEALTWRHDACSSLAKTAIASFTRLRPSRIPARKKSVRRCCFTVRGLMFSWAAISLLLQPWTSSFKTCSSRCVIFIVVRSNMVLPR